MAYRLVAAGLGTQRQVWGDDLEGTHEPFTVLRDDGGRIALVAATGFAGMEGGLAQASPRYGGDDLQRFTIGGKEALYWPGGGEEWADLLVARDEDTAVRVNAHGATREELSEIARRARPTGRRTAPAVAVPPSPWRVLGKVDADVAIALRAAVVERSSMVPGPVGAYGAGWLEGTRGALAVMTLPRAAADLEALEAAPSGLRRGHGPSKRVNVDGRRGVVLDACSCDRDPPLRNRAIVFHGDDENLVVVVAHGAEVPGEAELLDVAASVRLADLGAWERLLVQAYGRPDGPDPGEVVLARGEERGFRWILQTRQPEVGLRPGAELEVDPCLRVSAVGRAVVRRACAGSGGRGPGGVVYESSDRYWQPAVSGFPEFVVVMTRLRGEAVRVRTRSDEGVGKLYRLPSSGARAGVVFVDDVGPPTCGAFADSYATMRVELLGASRTVLRCIP